MLGPRFTKDQITPTTLSYLRDYWAPGSGHRPETLEHRVSARSIAFCFVGALPVQDVGNQDIFLSGLLNGNLVPVAAPCVMLDAESVAPVSIRQVAWGDVTHAEWLSLERVGLRRAVMLRLLSGQLDDLAGAPPRSPRGLLRESAALLASLCKSVGVVDRIGEATAAVTEVLLDEALAKVNGSRKEAAKILGISSSRLVQMMRAHPSLLEAWPAGPRGPKPSRSTSYKE